jgi:hypothetical protein
VCGNVMFTLNINNTKFFWLFFDAFVCIVLGNNRFSKQNYFITQAMDVLTNVGLCMSLLLYPKSIFSIPEYISITYFSFFFLPTTSINIFLLFLQFNFAVVVVVWDLLGYMWMEAIRYNSIWCHDFSLSLKHKAHKLLVSKQSFFLFKILLLCFIPLINSSLFCLHHEQKRI